MASIKSMHEIFYGERESVGYIDVHYKQLHPTAFDLMVQEAAPIFIYRESDSIGYNDVHYEQLHPTTFGLMVREAAPVFIYRESEPIGYNGVHYEQWHPTTFDLMGREAAPAPVYGYRERAEAFGSGATSSCYDGATLTRKSSKVQQGIRDRRSYVDTRDSHRYTRTVCPGYNGSPAITHYVSVNPTMATSVERGVAWPN